MLAYTRYSTVVLWLCSKLSFLSDFTACDIGSLILLPPRCLCSHNERCKSAMQAFRPLPQADLERAVCPIADLDSSACTSLSRKSTQAFSWSNLFRLKEYKAPTHEPSLTSQASSSISDVESRLSVLSPSTTLTEASSVAVESVQPSYKVTNEVRVFPHTPLPAYAEQLWQSKLPDRVRDECKQRIPDGRFSLHLWMSEAVGMHTKPCVIYIAHLGQKHNFGKGKDALLKKIEKKLRRLESLRDQDIPFIVSAGPASLLGMLLNNIPLPLEWLGLSSDSAVVNDDDSDAKELSTRGSESLSGSTRTTLDVPECDTNSSVEMVARGVCDNDDTWVYWQADSSMTSFVALPIFVLDPVELGGMCTVGGLLSVDSSIYALTTAHALKGAPHQRDEDAFSSLIDDEDDEDSVADSEETALSEHVQSTSATETSNEATVVQDHTKIPPAVDPLSENATTEGPLGGQNQNEEPPRSVGSGDRRIGRVITSCGRQRCNSSGSLDYVLISLIGSHQPSSNTYKDPDTNSVVEISSAISSIKELPAAGTSVLILAGYSGTQTAILGRIESRVTMDGITMHVAQLILETPLSKFITTCPVVMGLC